MTGDGVNDGMFLFRGTRLIYFTAPALMKANIGIAVADATDAARAGYSSLLGLTKTCASAADIVLLSPGLGVITDAIIGSRKIFQRMRNYVLYSLAATIRISLTFMLLTVIFDFYFPTIVVAIMVHKPY